MKENIKAFWVAAGTRAIHTVAQSALAIISTAAVLSEVNWLEVASASLLAGVISILKSVVVGVPEVEE